MNLTKVSITLGVCVALFVIAGNTIGPASLKATMALRSAFSRAALAVNAPEQSVASANPATVTPTIANPADTPAPEAKPATDATASSPAAQALIADYARLPTSAAAARPRRIGLFVSDSPIDSSSLGRIDSYASLGVDTVYNYSILDGSVADITGYLNKAQSRGIQVIFSLKDLYDPLGVNNYRTLYEYPIGDSNESAALNAVRQFGSHPAVWGFGISDERPESPGDLGTWQPIMQQRYNQIKQNTAKPVMMVLVGATSPSAGVRQQFLRSLRSSTDTFALDYYPIPFQPTSLISAIGQDLRAVGDGDGWFIAQAFSWSSYPDTARGLGFNVGSARLPTSAEMVGMAALALNGGAHNVMFYSYFDIAGNSAQLSALRQAISNLRN